MNKKNLSLVLFCAIAAILFLFPCLYVLNGSLMSGWETVLYWAEIQNVGGEGFLPLRMPPYEPNLHQYLELFFQRPEFLQTLINSFLYAGTSVLGMLITAPMAAFALAKLRFSGKRMVLLLFVFVMLLPYQVLSVGQYMAMRALDLLNSPWALILPEAFAPFAVFFLQQYMHSIPDSTLEAATIDGAGRMQTYLRVVLPLSRPALIAVAFLTAAKCWTMIEQPVLLLSTERKYPLSLFLHVMMGAQASAFFAACVIAIVPIFLLFLLFGDTLMESLALTES